MIDTSDGINAFFSDWGEDAIYSQAGELPTMISVVFDKYYQAVNFAAGTIESAKPAAIAKADDVSAAQQEEPIEVRGVIYKIANVQHAPEDLGEGLTRLILKKT